MKTRLLAAMGTMLLYGAMQEKAAPPDGLYLFFTPDSPGLVEIAKSLTRTPVRPVLLMTDLRAEMPESFLAFAKELGREFPVIDEEGLALAKRFGVRRTPCLIRVHNGRVHRFQGSKLDLKEMLECSR